jgi:altronate dehydratase
VLKVPSNTPIFQRMKSDLHLNTLGVIDRAETIEQVLRRVFERVIKNPSGEVQARAEEQRFREFQFWAEKSVSL